MKLITTKQLAERLGVTPARVGHLRKAGRIAEARRVGRDWLYPESAKVLFYPNGRPGKKAKLVPR